MAIGDVFQPPETFNLPEGGIPKGDGSGGRATALTNLFGSLNSDEQRNEFLGRFPGFAAKQNQPSAGPGSGGGGGRGGGFGGGAGGMDIYGLPRGVQGSLSDAILELLGGRQGEVGDYLARGENVLRESVGQNVLNSINQNAELFNSRGLLEGGQRHSDQFDIQQAGQQNLLAGLNQLQGQGLDFILRGMGQGIGGALGLGNLGLQGNELAFNQALQEALFAQGLGDRVFGAGTDVTSPGAPPTAFDGGPAGIGTDFLRQFTNGEGFTRFAF